MQLSIIVATLEGCTFEALDDAAAIDAMLEAAVAAGGFTLLHKHVHAFTPQGVTGAAVLSESHIAIHTWPEHGVLFVDIATCSGDEATRAAFSAICDRISHTKVNENSFGYRSPALPGVPRPMTPPFLQ